MIVRMNLDLADTFLLFLALAGPQKVLLSFARLGRFLDVRSLRLVAWTCSLAAACVGVLCALTAPWISPLRKVEERSLADTTGLVLTSGG